MELYSGNFQYAAKKAIELVNEHSEGIVVAISDDYYIAIGSINDSYNHDAAKQSGYTIFKGTWNGGTIVGAPGDIAFCIISEKPNQLAEQLIINTVKYLQNKDLKVARSGNDVLLYDNNIAYKVASYANTVNGIMYESVVQISIGTDNEIIKNICNKPCIKQPTALRNYGVSQMELYEYLYKNILNYYIN